MVEAVPRFYELRLAAHEHPMGGRGEAVAQIHIIGDGAARGVRWTVQR